MRFIELARKNKKVDPASWERLYEDEIVRLIRKKYSVNQEFAILRQRDEKPIEYAEYNEYVESCKLAVKAAMSIE